MVKEVVYPYNGILLNHKKEWDFGTCSNTDGFEKDYELDMEQQTGSK